MSTKNMLIITKGYGASQTPNKCISLKSLKLFFFFFWALADFYDLLFLRCRTVTLTFMQCIYVFSCWASSPFASQNVQRVLNVKWCTLKTRWRIERHFNILENYLSQADGWLAQHASEWQLKTLSCKVKQIAYIPQEVPVSIMITLMTRSISIQ